MHVLVVADDDRRADVADDAGQEDDGVDDRDRHHFVQLEAPRSQQLLEVDRRRRRQVGHAVDVS